MGVEFDDLFPLRHKFTPYKPKNGGFAGGIRKGDERCAHCGIGKAFHKVHDYHGYGHGDCMYCMEPEDSIMHEKGQKVLI